MSDPSWHPFHKRKWYVLYLPFVHGCYASRTCVVCTALLGSGHRSPGRIAFPIRGGLAGACLKIKIKIRVRLRRSVMGCDRGGLAWADRKLLRGVE